MFGRAVESFSPFLRLTPDGVFIPPEGRPLTRMIAQAFDAYDATKARHSAAV
jgi:oxygen-independent coproporphyrinogen-3 oxidase